MTDKQKMEWQSQQDQITLDFSAWSQQRTRAKLSNSHELWQTERDDVLRRQKASNDELRQKYLNGLAAAKAEKRREHEREIDAELEPTKLRLKREWLANNPNFTESDFESKAWIHLRQNLVEERSAGSLNAEIQAQMAKGRHSL